MKSVKLQTALHHRLKKEAFRRGITIESLAARILDEALPKTKGDAK